MAVDRESLFEQVWAEPMTKVAAKYGVSSSFMARVCERLNVPRPPRGYWAKLAVGKASPKPSLPAARPGDPQAWSRDGQLPEAPPSLPKPPEKRMGAQPRKRRPRSAQHPLIASARQHFEGVRESDSGHLRPTKRRLVDLFVSLGALDRALALANALFLELEQGGHRVTFANFDQPFVRPAIDERTNGARDPSTYGRWAPDRPTVVYLGTVAIGLTVFELSEEVELQYVGGKYVPLRQLPVSRRPGTASIGSWTIRRHMANGKLGVRATSPYAGASWEKQWRETRHGELAGKFANIAAELESAAPIIAALVEEAERRAEAQRREWELQRQKWEREEAERRRARHIKESSEQLSSIIEAWGAAKRVEEFFADAERRADAFSPNERAQVLERLRRARELTGGIDALQHFLNWKSPDER